MSDQPWLARARVELDELHERLAKLEDFTVTTEFSLLPSVDQGDMLNQKDAMDTYRKMLLRRIRRADKERP